MSGHTKGRLSVDPTGDVGDWIIGNADLMVAECLCDDFENDADAINAANARRLVACWNALLDVDTDFIERVPQSPGFTITQLLTRERDELVMMLRRVMIEAGEGGRRGRAIDLLSRKTVEDAEDLLAKYPVPA